MIDLMSGAWGEFQMVGAETRNPLALKEFVRRNEKEVRVVTSKTADRTLWNDGVD